MRSSRYLVLAVALAVAIAAQGCKRDYKAPEPKTDAAPVRSFTVMSVTVTSFAVTTLRGQ